MKLTTMRSRGPGLPTRRVPNPPPRMLAINVPIRKLGLQLLYYLELPSCQDTKWVALKRLNANAGARGPKNERCTLRDNSKQKSAVRDRTQKVCLVGLKVWVDSHSILGW
jgi:hypothetical protein